MRRNHDNHVDFIAFFEIVFFFAMYPGLDRGAVEVIFLAWVQLRSFAFVKLREVEYSMCGGFNSIFIPPILIRTSVVMSN